MKPNLTHTLALLVFLLGSNTLWSTTVKWLVKPNYDHIEVYCENVYKCLNDGKFQLYNSSGKTLLPHPCDSITDFSEGYALVLDKGIDSTKWKIKGFFTENGLRFIELDEGFYTMMYSFFSEGLIAVGNENNLYGYLNTQGAEAIPCRYQKARPFKQGWATVQFDSGRILYINKSAKPMIIDFHNGEVNDGTSFNQDGEAVIIHYKKKDMAVINTKGEVVRKYRKPDNVESFYRKYDRAFCENCQDDMPPQKHMPRYNDTIIPFLSDGLYGYKLSETYTVPAQFTYAERFVNQCAIVSYKGRYGILALANGNITSSIKGVKEGGNIDPQKKLTYSINLPKDMTIDEVKFDCGDGDLQTVFPKNNNYVFKPCVDKDSKSCVIHAEVYSDGLMLLEYTNPLGIRQETLQLAVSAPSSISEYANHKNLQTVKASVTNNSTVPIQVVVVFSASFKKGSANSWVNPESEGTIPPGETMDFFASVLVKQSESAKITATASVNNKKKTSPAATINLIPYD